MGAQCFTDFRVWQSAHKAALSVYRWTAHFPADERYGMTSQMRRAAVSIAANIAEGFGRRTARDRIHFYIMSRGSAQELRHYIILARDLGFPHEPEDLGPNLDSTMAMLYRLIEKVADGPIDWGV